MKTRLLVLSVRLLLKRLLLTPGVGTKRDRYEAVALLKHVESKVKKGISDLDPEMRKDAAASAERESSKTATYRVFRVGDVVAKKYDDSPSGLAYSASVEKTRAELAKFGVAPSMIEQCVVTTESVNIAAVAALVQLGQLTQEQYRGLCTEVPGKEGSFSVGTEGDLDLWLKQDVAGLLQEVVEDGDGVALARIMGGGE